MSDKDVNIHVKADGVQETEQQFGDLARQQLEFQQILADGNKKAADGTGKQSQSLLSMSSVIGNLKNGVVGMVAAFLGLETVKKIVNVLIERLERVRTLQKEIYEKGVDASKIGQALQFQTGTPGKQQEYTKEAATLQAKGGIRDINTAGQMMKSAQINFQKNGGIDNPQNTALLEEIAPMIGASGIGEEEVKAFMDIADKAKTPQNSEAYKTLFAKLKAAADASKTDFKDFLTNFQSATAGFISPEKGGTVEVAEKIYAGVRAVTGDDAAAASIFEQVTKLSEGGYKKPRQAIERKLHVKWEKLNRDQQAEALINYIQSLPEGKVEQTLEHEGFPSRGRFNLLATPAAKEAMQDAGKQTAAASAADMTKVGDEYVKSIVGVPETQKAKETAKSIDVAEEEANWQQRMTDALAKLKEKNRLGTDSLLMSDKVETRNLALNKLSSDIKTFRKSVPKGSELYRRATSLLNEIQSGSFAPMPGQPISNNPFLGTGTSENDWSNEFADLQKKAQPQKEPTPSPAATSEPTQYEPETPAKPTSMIINNNNQQITNYHPSVGRTEYQRTTFDT